MVEVRAVSWWVRSRATVGNFWGHWLQEYSLSIWSWRLCFFRCLFRWYREEKAFSHRLQSKGFFCWWMLFLCLFRLNLVENFFPHSSHVIDSEFFWRGNCIKPRLQERCFEKLFLFCYCCWCQIFENEHFSLWFSVFITHHNQNWTHNFRFSKKSRRLCKHKITCVAAVYFLTEH